MVGEKHGKGDEVGEGMEGVVGVRLKGKKVCMARGEKVGWGREGNKKGGKARRELPPASSHSQRLVVMEVAG